MTIVFNSIIGCKRCITIKTNSTLKDMYMQPTEMFIQIEYIQLIIITR